MEKLPEPRGDAAGGAWGQRSQGRLTPTPRERRLYNEMGGRGSGQSDIRTACLKDDPRASLAVQWLRTCLAMHGTWV